MANSLTHARGHNKAIGHLRFKATKEQQAKGNRFSFLACGVLAIICGFNFTAQEISNRITIGRAPHHVSTEALAHTPIYPNLTLFTGPRQLIVPVQGVPVSDLHDTWGQARSEGRVHEGIDIMAPMDTPVRAIRNGSIVKFFESGRGGITIYEADAEGRYIYYYAHLSSRAFGLAEGQQVQQGQVIGYVGQTGNATTPHLHFELQRMDPSGQWWKAESVNPYPYLLSGEVPH